MDGPVLEAWHLLQGSLHLLQAVGLHDLHHWRPVSAFHYRFNPGQYGAPEVSAQTTDCGDRAFLQALLSVLLHMPLPLVRDAPKHLARPAALRDCARHAAPRTH